MKTQRKFWLRNLLFLLAALPIWIGLAIYGARPIALTDYRWWLAIVLTAIGLCIAREAGEWEAGQRQ